MMTQSLLAVGFLMNLVAVIFVLSAIALILLVLIQKGKGGGLGGVIGGGMASNILGSKTGDFLTWLTIGLVVVFLTLSVVMAKYYRPSISQLDKSEASTPTVPADGSGTIGQDVSPSVDANAVIEQGREAVEEDSTIDVNSIDTQ